MKKIILYINGPRILSKRIFLVIFLIPIFGLIITFYKILAILLPLCILFIIILLYSLTAINAGDAIIIDNNIIFFWKKGVKSRIKKPIKICEIEKISIKGTYLTVKLWNKVENDYFFNSKQTAIVLAFLKNTQIAPIFQNIN